jgi:EmrB/QacA subfamily drug resistance transporter
MGNKYQKMTLLVFLLGIFIGAIDSGIVSPARTVIQNQLGAGENAGVWMITIYTLVYAVSMPIVSKLSDRYGRKKVYLSSILVFGIGSLMCAITNFNGSFTLLLISRVIQAIGGGGITPIATAFIGQSFPPEKRGTALGLVGGIYGIATILGPTMGSTILDIAGAHNWGWLFLINVPICIFIILLGLRIKENKGEEFAKLDISGSVSLSIVIVSLMYALTNINFFSFKESIQDVRVYPYLIIFVLAFPIFIAVEKRAEDPILNLKYFKNSQIALTLILGFLTGAGLMGIVFVPQFAENVLKLKTGSGGYLVTLMSVFAGVTSPLGGKLIDKYSAKIVMLAGFLCMLIGTLYLALVVVNYPVFINMLIGLGFVGFGIGFTMGTPLNYLMLTYVNENESASALSTLSLIRSIGVTVSPNIMINFIAEAGKSIPDKLRAAMPELGMPDIPGIERMASDYSMTNSNFTGSLSTEAIQKFKEADVTTAVNVTKDVMSSVFDKIIPEIQSNILGGLDKAIAAVQNANNDSVQAFSAVGRITSIKERVPEILINWKESYIQEIESKRVILENIFQSTLNQGFKNMFIAAAIIAVIGLVLSFMLEKKKMKAPVQ